MGASGKPGAVHYDPGFWYEPFLSPDAERRVVYHTHTSPGIRIEADVPAGYTWTRPLLARHWLWLTQGAPLSSTEYGAALRASLDAPVLAFYESSRPDAMAGVPDRVPHSIDASRYGLGMFGGWTVEESLEPVAVAWMAAAARVVLAGAHDGERLRAVVVVGAWKGVQSVAVAVVSRPEASRHADALLAHALETTTLSPF